MRAFDRRISTTLVVFNVRPTRIGTCLEALIPLNYRGMKKEFVGIGSHVGYYYCAPALIGRRLLELADL